MRIAAILSCHLINPLYLHFRTGSFSFFNIGPVKTLAVKAGYSWAGIHGDDDYDTIKPGDNLGYDQNYSASSSQFYINFSLLFGVRTRS